LTIGLDAQEITLFDSNGFNGYNTGPLPGQHGWINNTTVPFSPPQVIQDPTGSGMTNVIEFDPFGNGNPGGQVGAHRQIPSSTGALFIIEWDQYRADIINNTAPEGDNFWCSDNKSYTNWWAIQSDQTLTASAKEYPPPGVAIKGHAWQHVRYLFNYIASTVAVEVDGQRIVVPMPNPPYSGIRGINFELAPTPSGLPDDGPVYLDNVKISEVDFMTDKNQLDQVTGGSINLYLDASNSNAGRLYLILGTISGVSPGTPLPGGSVILPINWDAFTHTNIVFLNTPIFFQFLGILNSNGRASAKFQTASLPGLSGVVIHFAFALSRPWDYASDPVRIEIVS